MKLVATEHRPRTTLQHHHPRLVTPPPHQRSINRRHHPLRRRPPFTHWIHGTLLCEELQEPLDQRSPKTQNPLGPVPIPTSMLQQMYTNKTGRACSRMPMTSSTIIHDGSRGCAADGRRCPRCGQHICCSPCEERIHDPFLDLRDGTASKHGGQPH